MFKQVSSVAIVLSGLVFTASASANQVSLERMVSGMLAQAVAATQQEISYGVQEAVLTANHMMSFDESEAIATTITITDLDDTQEKAEQAE